MPRKARKIRTNNQLRFPDWREGYEWPMSLALLLIVIGIVLAILVHYALGIVLILIGLALLIVPRLTGGDTRRV